MRKIVLLVLLTVGCSDASKQIEKLADRACECKDAACADKVVDDLVQFAKDNPNASGDQAKGVEQAQRLGKCAMKAGADPAKMVEKMKALQNVK
jgi:hypothetical protein